jgi:hypothetical protein
MTKIITRRILLLALALAVPATGCGGDAKKGDDKAAKADAKKADEKKADEKKAEPEGPKPSMDSPEGRVALAAMVATEIAGTPDKADEILEQNGLDRDKLDELMYEIAKDPELSKAYKEQRMNG